MALYELSRVGHRPTCEKIRVKKVKLNIAIPYTCTCRPTFLQHGDWLNAASNAQNIVDYSHWTEILEKLQVGYRPV